MHARAHPFERAGRLVVKVGSALLVAPEGQPRRDWLATLAADIAARRAAGQQVAIVSSGAIALGARRLGLKAGGRASLEDAQAAASVGQIALAALWSECLGAHGLTAAQLLLTLDDLEDRRRFLNAAATLDRLMTLGAVPVINENDSVATAEIRFGDNDRLAARVGVAARAQAVLLLSDVDGLFTANPQANPSASLVPEVRDLATLAVELDGRGTMGTGGMAAKVEAARLATRAGLWLAIAGGRGEHPLAGFLRTGRGTVFHPSASPAAGLRAWLGGRARVAGRLVIDAGAVAALKGGASLLPVGVRGVEGRFARGDVVAVVGPDGTTVARGLAAYSAEEAQRIAGRRGDALADALGYAPRAAMIHRDHMVLA